uniref:Coiled-coil domain containing 151 n=1 Tax=Seriola dumerili TaxID=41447 RepID=A0A3B4TQZ2_SERDU
MKDGRTPPLRRRKTSDKRVEEQDSPSKQVWDGNDKYTTRQKPLSRLGHPLEKKLEQEKVGRFVLINEHNRLTQAVKEKKAKLKRLQESLKAMHLQPATYNNEDTLKQHIRQLENNAEKMKKKITEAKKIQVTYHHICENLQQEVRDIYQVLEQRERAVADRQAKVDNVTKMLQSAEAAADGTLGRMVQVEHETMETRREMAGQLCELSTEVKELKKDMETFGRLSPRGQSRMKERETEEEEARLDSVEDQQCYDLCGASGYDMKPVKDMEPVSEALGCADVQKLVNKMVSQRATEEQLATEKTQYDELIEQDAQILADLDLQCAELKFSEKPAAIRFEKLKKQIQAKPVGNHVERLHASLEHSQDLLDTVEQGVNTLYFRMSSVPVEGFRWPKCTDCTDKLRDISAPLSTLLQSTSMQTPETRDMDQETFYSLLESFNTMELSNNKRPTTPTDAPQLSDEEEEEECCPSRDEIKRCSIRLIEAQQSKKSSRRVKL